MSLGDVPFFLVFFFQFFFERRYPFEEQPAKKQPALGDRGFQWEV